jgi:hypothetical protein
MYVTLYHVKTDAEIETLDSNEQERAIEYRNEQRKLMAEIDGLVERMSRLDDDHRDYFILRMGTSGVTHRTLQQRFTTTVLRWLKHLSLLSENQFDGRNEAAVQMAKEFATVGYWFAPEKPQLPCV